MNLLLLLHNFTKVVHVRHVEWSKVSKEGLIGKLHCEEMLCLIVLRAALQTHKVNVTYEIG